MYYKQTLLQKLEYKLGRYAIKNLMTILIGAMAIFFAVNFMLPDGINIYNVFAFYKPAIAQGQVWRIFTFIFLPPGSNLLFIIFALYFYWLIGSSMEHEWGAFRFNIFYLCGMIGTIIAGVISGFATNEYLNLSLFIAAAILFPNFEIRLFLLIPVKMKWLGYLSAAYLLFMLVMVLDSWRERTALLVSLLNIILFFGKDFIQIFKRAYAWVKWKQKFR